MLEEIKQFSLSCSIQRSRNRRQLDHHGQDKQPIARFPHTNYPTGKTINLPFYKGNDCNS